MDATLFQRIVPIFGLLTLIGISLLISTNRSLALSRWRLIAWGFGLQVVFGLIVLHTTAGRWLIARLNDFFVALIDCTYAGAEFVFGPLARSYGPDSMATVGFVEQTVAGAADPQNDAFIFAFFVLSTIVFFSALTSILYHLNVLQWLVKIFAIIMQRTLKTSGAETLSASANIFVGQTEAPLLVRPFIKDMTRSELMTVMTGGFATVAGSVLALYIFVLGDIIPDVGGHLMAASVMSAPAALVFGKLMVPETEVPKTANTLEVNVKKESVNLFDAATIGTTAGLKLALNVGAMLLAFLALIAVINLGLAGLAYPFTGEDTPEWLKLEVLLGYLFAPFAWLLGITDWNEAVAAGQLLGLKMVANEFVAYLGLSGAAEELSERSRVIMTYALCGFANFGSIGIMIGGLTVMAPNARPELSRLALRAMLAGTFAANATGCVVAVLL
ncbi:MAG: NupC/NupG family nucleoside CNT transporter [Candidatus Sumerlaeia bacterium]|nr:NupC/NupG family nucleoside CNT transporter [Candidatus Sumerlaeia bacterium]